jgi:hypothetical protein
MRTRWLLIGIGAVAVLFVLYGQGYLSGVIGGGHQDSIAVAQGWNEVVVPDNWHDTTAKALCAENPSITALSHTVGAGLASYLPSYADSYSFDITPGMSLWIFASEAGTVNAP